MKATRLVIHCTATKNGKTLPMALLRKWHVDENGWKNIGYHAVFQPCGQYYDYKDGLRALNEQGAGVRGENKNTIHYALVGTDKFTTQQFERMRYHIECLEQQYDIPSWEIYGHYEFDSAKKQGKTCPNIRMRDLLVWYLTGEYKPIMKNVLMCSQP